MRRAYQKIKIAFYEGKRIGISEAIDLFYNQNGFSKETFNMTALMRKEFIRTQNLENNAKATLFKISKKGNVKSDENKLYDL